MSKGLLLEIRPGTGGEEASLFASNLLEMYFKFATRQKWPVKVLNFHQTSLGGVKEATLEISSPEAFNLLKQEAGVHRVQRIPKTEKSGRVHTSTATVAILPKRSEVKIKINPSDLKMDTYRASGAGGQYVNKTESAVRITHLPTRIAVACQSERSQATNREKAMEILQAKLAQLTHEQQQGKITTERKSQIGTAERSEKIRTYNFPQDRITDHRIKKSWHNLNNILNGRLDVIIKAFQKKQEGK